MTDTSLIDEVRDLVDREAAGQKVEKFLAGETGGYITHKVQATVDTLTAQLKTVDPGNMKAVMQLQERIALYEQFFTWLADAVIEGDNATATLASIESQD